MADPLIYRGPVDADFYSGWHSMQIGLMLKVYVKGDKQHYVNQYLSSLRPEIADCLVKDADDLFPPTVAGLIKNYKGGLEWS